MTSWPRPTPLIGDTTAAAERAADPSGWALGAETVTALHRVIGARRDIRRYRPDPVPADLLRSVLAAGHQAPSVGHSQPWRFLVVTEQATRDRAALLSDRERLRQAELLEPDRRARLLDLQLEGIREAPVGIVVACDRRAAAAGVLGRAGFPDADLWSCACAIQNIWLAARAAGLGVGWVTLFQPADLARLTRLPDGVQTLGWLCLGWPDERPPEPGLERAGWSQRLTLDQVVLSERWPDEGQPPPPPSYLAPAAAQPPARAELRAPEPRAVVAARDTGDRLLSPPGSLGVLDAAVNRVLALGRPDLDGGSLVLVAAEHPVTAHQISAYPPSVSEDVFAATVAGQSLGASAARAAGLSVRAVRARARDRQGDLVASDALSSADVMRLLDEGKSLGRAAAATGLVCLGEVAVGNTTVAAALAASLLGLTAEQAVGLGVGADAAMLERKRSVVTAAGIRAAARHGDGLAEPLTLLAALGGPEFAMLAGVVLGAAQAGSPVVLDGCATSVAALLAIGLEPAAQAYLIAGQRSRELAHSAVLTGLGLEPLLELRLRAGEGVGACLAAGLLLTGLRVRRTAGQVSG
ncbi:MAG TPA: 5,6-dimethylbenzimidazole synthase [Jatrophihabitans sp.]|uniref:5,6-dimethylbenzimidazole synthase n=1 Tax=Jatrophihabitans sp. TaxID=1932789 RepID=UPI002EE86004